MSGEGQSTFQWTVRTSESRYKMFCKYTLYIYRERECTCRTFGIPYSSVSSANFTTGHNSPVLLQYAVYSAN